MIRCSRISTAISESGLRRGQWLPLTHVLYAAQRMLSTHHISALLTCVCSALCGYGNDFHYREVMESSSVFKAMMMSIVISILFPLMVMVSPGRWLLKKILPKAGSVCGFYRCWNVRCDSCRHHLQKRQRRDSSDSSSLHTRTSSVLSRYMEWCQAAILMWRRQKPCQKQHCSS